MPARALLQLLSLPLVLVLQPPLTPVPVVRVSYARSDPFFQRRLWVPFHWSQHNPNGGWVGHSSLAVAAAAACPKQQQALSGCISALQAATEHAPSWAAAGHAALGGGIIRCCMLQTAAGLRARHRQNLYNLARPHPRHLLQWAVVKTDIVSVQPDTCQCVVSRRAGMRARLQSVRALRDPSLRTCMQAAQPCRSALTRTHMHSAHTPARSPRPPTHHRTPMANIQPIGPAGSTDIQAWVSCATVAGAP